MSSIAIYSNLFRKQEYSFFCLDFSCMDLLQNARKKITSIIKNKCSHVSGLQLINQPNLFYSPDGIRWLTNYILISPSASKRATEKCSFFCKLRFVLFTINIIISSIFQVGISYIFFAFTYSLYKSPFILLISAVLHTLQLQTLLST